VALPSGILTGAMQARTVYKGSSPHHEIHVEDVGYIRVLRFSRNRQSTMYLDAPYDTDFEYPGFLHTPVAIKPDARRTLVIGLGGGTVIKRMWRDYPDMWIDAVELDAEVVRVARDYFALPDDDRIQIHIGDGRLFVDTSIETYDIVIIDAFDEDAVPRPLKTEEFLRSVRDHMSPDGALAMNFIGAITGDRSKPFRSLYKTLGNVFRRVRVFQVTEGVDTDGANIVLLATDADVSDGVFEQRIMDRVGGKVTVPAFAGFCEQLYTKPIRTGDVPLIVDPQKPRR
jgi:spermidine synthase